MSGDRVVVIAPGALGLGGRLAFAPLAKRGGIGRVPTDDAYDGGGCLDLGVAMVQLESGREA